jgi:hypothetical protein
MVLAVNQIEGSFGGQPSIEQELAYLAEIRQLETMLLSDPIGAIEWWSGRSFRELVIEEQDAVFQEFDEIIDFTNFIELLTEVICDLYVPLGSLSLDNEAINEVIDSMISSIIEMTYDWFHSKMSQKISMCRRDEYKEMLMTEPRATVRLLLAEEWEECTVSIFLITWICDGSQNNRCQEIAAMTVQMLASEVAKGIYDMSFGKLPFDPESDQEMVDQIADVIVPDIRRIFNKERDEVIGQLDYIRKIAKKGHF